MLGKPSAKNSMAEHTRRPHAAYSGVQAQEVEVLAANSLKKDDTIERSHRIRESARLEEFLRVCPSEVATWILTKMLSFQSIFSDEYTVQNDPNRVKGWSFRYPSKK